MQTRPFSTLVSILVFSALPTLGCAIAADGSAAPQPGEEQPGVEPEALTSVTNSCVCVGSTCGNSAVGGNHGQVVTGLSTPNVVASYGPDRIGSEITGWACRPTGTNSCVCVGSTCGNNAAGGAHGQVVSGLSTSTVIASYGPDRIGSEITGWKCRLSGI